MSRRCPNCKYERKPTDHAPDWQCPACEMAYNKGAGADVPENYGRHGVTAASRPSPGSGLARWLVLLVVIGLVVWAGKPLWQVKSAINESKSAGLAGQPEVTLYATDWCAYCAASRKFFAANGIRYTELNIENNSVGKEGFR